MNKNAIAKLKDIRSFTSLVKYLREEMSWPIESDNFDLLTFDYTPEELGIDSQNAAKIQEIKRLRPLETNQPWGIFFVKFEPKKLPVVALRRILSRVVEKKRASANKSDQVVWRSEDLLFVSNYGDSGERQIAVAHFSEDANKHDLPTLKVLGWDNSDTALHLDQVADALTHQLAWPAQGTSPDAWRTQWRSAFTVEHREVINTSKELAESLANLAGNIRDRIKTTLKIENDKGPLRTLMVGFQKSLIHDLDSDGFADMYAQTIAYGLLSARIAQPTGSSADDLAAHMRTSPFLRELMETFLKVGGRRGKAGGSGIDFDELGVSEVQDLLERANMNAVLADFGDRNQQEDPVMHFFEGFLQAYDAKIKKGRGVFYTPHPVVSYIVRSVHELLQTEFGLVDGLADTTTWGEMCKSHKDLQIPQGTSPDQSFVQILDPATGTGTFIVEVIDIIHKTMTAKWTEQGHGEKKIESLWNEYVPKHLLPRLHAYELMMAPYAIAHLKVGLKLKETGYGFGSDERARIYLTNALEPAQNFSGIFEFAIPALAHEAEAVNEIKRRHRFTVVIGNPPYSHQSSNLTAEAMAIVEPYKYIKGERIQERGALSLQKNLQDDYVKFIRLAEHTIEAASRGVVGLITNNSYLDSRSFRGMRYHLHDTFDRGWILDLHGSSKKTETVEAHESRDENVFDIMQGVAITLWMRSHGKGNGQVHRADVLGARQGKYEVLSERAVNTTMWKLLQLAPPFYPFIHQDMEILAEYQAYVTLREIFPIYSSGIKTHRDDFAISFSASEMADKLQEFCDSSLGDKELRNIYGLKDTNVWSLKAQRGAVKLPVLKQAIRAVQYRPFDVRSTCFSDEIIELARRAVMNQMTGAKNLALLCCQQQAEEGYQHVFCTRLISECCSVSNRTRETTSAFPLWLIGPVPRSLSQQELSFGTGRTPNVDPIWLNVCGSSDDAFNVVYSLLHSPLFRARYAAFLRSDFPRLPLPGSQQLVRALSCLGGELVALHLMESPKLDHIITIYTGPKNPEVGRVGWSDDTVWLDAAATKKGQPATPGTTGFRGVPEAVWNFHIGGYQVCEKWLKDRKGRKLSKEDIAHYQKIVVALSETIRLMKEIDEVIVKHGGWPGAFQTNSVLSTSEPAKENAVSNKD